MTVERDFWEIVEEGSLSHDVKVLYGNDLPTLHYGSGFPVDPADEYHPSPSNRPCQRDSESDELMGICCS